MTAGAFPHGTQRSAMIKAPAWFRCRPKNTADQSVLIAICKYQRPSAKAVPGCIATRVAAHDIST
jgi:hypothetical protein